MSNVLFYEPELKKKGAWLDWRSKYSGGFGWRHNIDILKYYFLAIHHSVTKGSGSAKKDVELILKIHKNRGWGGIGYNFIVTTEEKNGYAKVAYVGDIGSARAHTPNKKGALGVPKNLGNNHIMAICIVGAFHEGQKPTPAQMRSLHLLTNEIIKKEKRFPRLNVWSDLRGHKEFDYTACPSNQLTTLKAEIAKNSYAIKPPTPPVKPPAPKPEYETSYKPFEPARKLKTYASTNNVNMITGILQPIPANKPIDVAGEFTNKGKKYYRTVWSADNNVWAGIPQEAFDAPEPPKKPDPQPQPDEDKAQDNTGTTPYPEGEDARGDLQKIRADVSWIRETIQSFIQSIKDFLLKVEN